MLMDAERDKREARNKMYFERYSPVVIGILMYGAVDKINLARQYSKLASYFVPKLKICTVKKNSRYCGRYHSSAYIFSYFGIGTRTYINGYRGGKRTHD